MSSNNPFYNPKDAGKFDLGITQQNKKISFKSIDGVFDASAKVEFFHNSSSVHNYTIGNGLTIVGTNTQGTEKTLELVMNGSDFSAYAGQTLDVKCTFFVLGDIEVIFKLQVI